MDELISFCGLLRDTYENDYYQALIAEIQDRLMTIASILSADERIENLPLPKLYEADIRKLEDEIDKMDETLPTLRSFILPGGNAVVTRLCLRPPGQSADIHPRHRIQTGKATSHRWQVQRHSGLEP